MYDINNIIIIYIHTYEACAISIVIAIIIAIIIIIIII